MQVIDDEAEPTESLHGLQELYRLRALEVVKEERGVYDVECLGIVGRRECIRRFDLDLGAKRGGEGLAEMSVSVPDGAGVSVEAYSVNGAVEASPSAHEMAEVVGVSAGEIENPQFVSIPKEGVEMRVGTGVASEKSIGLAKVPEGSKQLFVGNGKVVHPFPAFESSREIGKKRGHFTRRR